MKAVAILYNLRSVYNTASCFRTADGVGLDKLYLVGTTPPPLDRFKIPRSDFAKVALGAEKTTPYQKTDDIKKLLLDLKKKNYLLIAIEQSPNSKDIFSFPKPKKNMALIFGPEVIGLPKDILEQCDHILEIPMRGKKESLNIATAFGIATYILK